MSSAVTTRALMNSFDDVTAVRALDLTINEGEMFCLAGPDGAGKTTTLRMLAGVLTPDAGDATVAGYNLRTQRRFVCTSVGYLSQRFSLYTDLTIDENLEFFAEIHDVTDYHARREELLRFTRLTNARTRLADQLSGGMKQKLALAATLIHSPKILFLDEPTTGVDPLSRRDLWKILSSLVAEGMTIVLSTPYLDEAERCDRVAFIHRGAILHVGTPPELKKLLEGDVVEIVTDRVREAAALLRAHPAVRSAQTFGDRLDIIVADAERDLAGITSALEQSSITITDTRSVEPTLDNVFFSLLEREET